ncbi:hypothetical protein [Robertkochia flava]|nr:hypothetical protein [Robertkochia marina]
MKNASANFIVENGIPRENLDLMADPERNYMVILKDGKIILTKNQNL